MNVNICDALGNEINDLIRLIKDQTIRTTNISSFKMNEYNISNNGERINAYTLIPGLEENIIIEITDKDGNKKIYLIKERLFSEISLETLYELRNRNEKIEISEDKSDEAELLEQISYIPEEIKEIDQIFSVLAVESDNTTINNIFKSFCENVKFMRNNQKDYMTAFRNNNIIRRSL